MCTDQWSHGCLCAALTVGFVAIVLSALCALMGYANGVTIVSGAAGMAVFAVLPLVCRIAARGRAAA